MSQTEILYDKMTFLLKKDELARLHIEMTEQGEPFIKLDVHGWSIAKTETILNKMLLLIKCEFNLDIIHGYMHGCKIKAMLTGFKNARIEKKRGYNENPGLTYMKIMQAA